jgi:hypothetical protein
MSTREFLEKATLTSADLVSNGGFLGSEQVKEFLKVAQSYTAIMQECRHETSNSKVLEVPRLSFGTRIMKPGVEGARLADGDRVEPTTGLLSLSTVLIKGEVHVSDEALEDNVEGEGLADTFMQEIAKAVGRDVEELCIKGDTARVGGEDTYLDLLDGLIKQLQTNLSSTKELDATAETSYAVIFGKLLAALEPQYQQDPSELRLYLPAYHAQRYASAIAARGTPLGDSVQVDGLKAIPSFHGVPIRQTPIMAGIDTINSGAIDYSKFCFITHPKNIVVGWHRKIRVERFRDPRDGATSFLPTCRVAVGFGDPADAVYAYNMPTTLV